MNATIIKHAPSIRDIKYEPLTFHFSNVNSITMPSALKASLCYRHSSDNKNWSEWENIGRLETTEEDYYFQFKARDKYVGTGIYSSYSFFNSWGITDEAECYGNILSLINNNILDAYAFSGMFYGCTGLTSAPELPAETLADRCYYNMFYGCTGLTSAPKLPAETLANYCYGFMFYGCTGLTSAPKLPAETLSDYCYGFMFYGCTGLTSAPELLAETLENNCYEYMFYGCTKLNYIKSYAKDISASNCLTDWVYSTQTIGGFYCLNGMENTYEIGDSGIPVNWTVHTF